MMKYFISAVICLCSSFFAWKNENILNNTYLTDTEEMLGKDFSSKKPKLDLPGVSAKAGEALVIKGFVSGKEGKKAGKQSKHFVCTSCHNIRKEDPDLVNPNPEARLKYAEQMGLPFLQGSPLYGVINRNTYYNGDYDQKYGDLVLKARNDIREAIQLCATECAQGRKLKDWEVESILAYFWTIGIKMEDVNLSEAEKTAIENAAKKNDADLKLKSLDLLALKYKPQADATFVPPPADRKTGNGLVGDKVNGQKIYKLSCLHCHQNQKYSFLDLDESKMSLAYLSRHLDTYHRQSVYQVTRWGVPVYSGKKSYMPQYTLERLSEQQLADLVSYIQEN